MRDESTFLRGREILGSENNNKKKKGSAIGTYGAISMEAERLSAATSITVVSVNNIMVFRKLNIWRTRLGEDCNDGNAVDYTMISRRSTNEGRLKHFLASCRSFLSSVCSSLVLVRGVTTPSRQRGTNRQRGISDHRKVRTIGPHRIVAWIFP